MLTPSFASPVRLRAVVRRTAFGWVELPKGTSPSELVATCDGTPCVLTFGGPETDLADLVRFAFRVSLPEVAEVAEIAEVDAVRPLRLAIRHARSPATWPGATLVITPDTRWGELEGITGVSCRGWATSFGEARPALELCVDDVVVRTFVPDEPYAPFLADHATRARVAFSVPLPDGALDGATHWIGVRFAQTGMLLPPGETAFRFAPKGFLDRVGLRSVEGWVFNPGSKDAPFEIELRVDGERAGKAKTSLDRGDVATLFGRRRVGFQFALDDACALSDRAHTVELLAFGTERPVLGPLRVTLPTFRAIEALERWSANTLPRGAAACANSAEPPADEALVLELLRAQVIPSVLTSWRRDLEGGRVLIEVGMLDAAAEDALALAASKRTSASASVDVGAVRARAVASRGVHTLPILRAIEALERWSATTLPPGPALPSKLTTEQAEHVAIRTLLRAQILPSVLDSWQLARVSGRTALEVTRATLRAAPDATRPVDVIIPVYKGRQETMACIASVLAANVETPHRIIVIDDASPDTALRDDLRRVAASPRLILLENATNRGFVATVNRGMRESATNDVVLLNSDTIVAPGWLDALTRAAYARDEIGTVTPLSNRATICSVPRMNVDNDLPEGFDAAAMHRLCAREGSGGLVDIPTAVGFCMYIRRDALDDVGLFDEERWKKGYGEENDFCVRARARGYRSVAATDCFVEHLGSVSFAGEKTARVRQNMQVLDGLYPDFTPSVMAFITDDPLRPIRNRINVAILAASPKRRVLHVLHHLGGGTQTAVGQMADELERLGYASLVASPRGTRGIAITTREADVSLDYDLEREASAFAAALAAMGVDLVHVHHVAAYPAAILDAIRASGVPFVVTLHDYFFACPRVDLRDWSGRFCDLAPASICEGCVNAADVPPHARSLLAAARGSVARWRTMSSAFLRAARRVIAPSEDTARRMRRAFPSLEITARAHPDRRSVGRVHASSPDPFGVAILGAIGEHKGYRELVALARHATAIGSPIRFTVIGHTCDDVPLRALDNVTITGAYASADLADLVRDSGASVALFLSPWSETYSYTLSDAFELGLYPVSLDLGAFRERIEAARWGELVPPDIAIADLHTRLMDVLSSRQAPDAVLAPDDPWRASPASYYAGLLPDLLGAQYP